MNPAVASEIETAEGRPSRGRPRLMRSQRRTTMKKFAIATVTAVLLSTAAHADDCEINLEKYNHLKIGMAYSEVVKILGCEGIVSYVAKGASYKIESYNWEGLYIVMMNGNVLSKSHSGLR
jgi:hypothetical protein